MSKEKCHSHEAPKLSIRHEQDHHSNVDKITVKLLTFINHTFPRFRKKQSSPRQVVRRDELEWKKVRYCRVSVDIQPHPRQFDGPGQYNKENGHQLSYVYRKSSLNAANAQSIRCCPI
jgi:hypothetical protein